MDKLIEKLKAKIKAKFGTRLEKLMDDKRFRVYLPIILGAIIAVSVLTSVCVQCASGCDSCSSCSGESPAREPVYLSFGRLESMEFLEESYYISAGSQLGLRLRTHPETYDDTITWSSSDATVLRVDSSGVVTARGMGTAAITASTESCSATVTISVVDNLLVEAMDCVRMLSEGCDTYAFSAAQLMSDKLAHSSAEGAKNVKNTIDAIIAYKDGGDRAALDAAIAASGMNGTLCRTAAACCWAYGEQQRCDAVLSFAGDCTLARFNEDGGQGRFPSVYEASDSPTYPFDRVKGIFACDDLTLINFEGALTDSTKHCDKTFCFRGNPSYARMLPASSIEAATVANNHSYDYYQTGYEDTLRHLTGAGVQVTCAEQPLVTQAGAVPVVMIAASAVGESYTDAVRDALLEAIGEHKNAGNIVVVNLHWGVEGSDRPEQWQRNAAHELIDAGADLIVGHHPHVMQGIEIYNEKYIAYSLGNFAFGGNISANSPRTYILRARLTLDDSGKAAVEGISVLPCRTTSTGNKTNNYQPMLCFGKDGDGGYSELMRLNKGIGGAESIDRPDV